MRIHDACYVTLATTIESSYPFWWNREPTSQQLLLSQQHNLKISLAYTTVVYISVLNTDRLSNVNFLSTTRAPEITLPDKEEVMCPNHFIKGI